MSSSRRGRGGGREKSLQELMGRMAKKGTATAVAEPDEAPPVEPADSTWPPPEPVDDDTAATNGSGPTLSAVPDPRQEPGSEPEAATGPEPAAVTDPEPEAATDPEPEAATDPEPEATTDPEPEAAAGAEESVEVVDAEPVDDEESSDGQGKVVALRGDADDDLAVQERKLLPQLPQFQPAPAHYTPEQQLEHYEEILSGANQGLGTLLDLANRQWLLYVAWCLEPVREFDLWKTRGFASFDAYCKDQWGFSGDYANKKIRARPVVEALIHVTAKEFNEGQLRPLIPVYRDHGAEAVVNTWREAERQFSSTAGAALVKAGKRLGYIKAGTEEEAEEKKPEVIVQLPPVRERVQQWLKPIGDLIQEDPKDTLTAIREGRKLLDRFEAQAKEAQAEARKRAKVEAQDKADEKTVDAYPEAADAE